MWIHKHLLLMKKIPKKRLNGILSEKVSWSVQFAAVSYDVKWLYFKGGNYLLFFKLCICLGKSFNVERYCRFPQDLLHEIRGTRMIS